MPPMVRFARIVLVALLVAMIPAKGFAAARMLFCGMASDRTAMMAHGQSGMSGGAHHGAGHGADQANAQPPCHAADAGVAGHGARHGGSAGGASGDGTGPDDQAPTHEASCSVCAVCSSATAIASVPVMPSDLAASYRAATARLVHFVGHIPPTLDRPPLG